MPKGNFLPDYIHSEKQKFSIHRQKDGVILGSPYKRIILSGSLNDPRYKKSPHQSLLYAGRAQDIMISGEGMIDGNAQLISNSRFP